ncbi:MAG TPA: hypothetical protein VHQ47_08500 [Phycisphaerae bacterium]|nr:hypothetical protein [Phycisphaerae bacterium]
MCRKSSSLVLHSFLLALLLGACLAPTSQPASTTLPLTLGGPESPLEFEARIVRWNKQIDAAAGDPAPLADAFLQRLREYRYVTPATVYWSVSAMRENENRRQSAKNIKPTDFQYPDTISFIAEALQFSDGNPHLRAQLLQLKASALEGESDLQAASDAYGQAAELLVTADVDGDLARIQCFASRGSLEERLGHKTAALQAYSQVLSYAWYQVSDSEKMHEFIDLYEQAGRSTIELNRRDLKALQQLAFIPATLDQLGPPLQAAIKEAQQNKTPTH